MSSADCKNRKSTSPDNRGLESLIEDLCKIILIEEDHPNFEAAQNYISNLKNEEIIIINEHSKPNYRLKVREHVENHISRYLDGYYTKNKIGAPFDFDSGQAYQEYRNRFIDEYKNRSNNADLPDFFEYVFDCIKESSEQYRHFDNFYKIRQNLILSQVDQTMQNSMNSIINESVKQATKLAEEHAKTAAEKAEKAALNAESAANKAVSEEMNRVSRTVSETTVTVLGIFAAIILTIVAGLIYSSSIINNMNSANFYRLIAVGALVGFVCFNLIAVMLRFISKYRHTPEGKENEADKNSGYSKMMFFVSCSLLVIFIVFTILQFCLTDPIYDAQASGSMLK